MTSWGGSSQQVIHVHQQQPTQVTIPVFVSQPSKTTTGELAISGSVTVEKGSSSSHSHQDVIVRDSTVSSSTSTETSVTAEKGKGHSFELGVGVGGNIFRTPKPTVPSASLPSQPVQVGLPSRLFLMLVARF